MIHAVAIRSSVPFQLLGVTESPRALAVLAHRFPRASLEPDERRASGWHQGITSLLVKGRYFMYKDMMCIRVYIYIYTYAMNPYI